MKKKINKYVIKMFHFCQQFISIYLFKNIYNKFNSSYENRENNSDCYYNREVHRIIHTKADFDMVFYGPYPIFFYLPTKCTIGMPLVALSILRNGSRVQVVDSESQNFLLLLAVYLPFLFLRLLLFLNRPSIEFLWYHLQG